MAIDLHASPAPPSGIARLFAVFAPVRRSELVGVVLLTVNVLVLLSCYYLLKVLREPLILLGGGAELKAYASAGQTLLLLGVVPAFGWLSNRVSRLRLLTTVQLIFIGCLVAFYALAEAHAPIGLAFYLWLGIFNVLVISNFWSFANDVYTPEQGKRLFAVIGIGASIGAIIGAYVPKLIHRAVGLHGLFLYAAAGLALSIALYQLVDRRAPDRATDAAAPPTPPEERASAINGFGLVMRNRYLRLLAFMVLVATVINTTGEYVIGKMATDRAGELAAAARDEYLSSFYSGYYTAVNVLSALLQAFVVGRLLHGLGIRRALFVMPLIVLGGWFALLLFTTVSTVRVEKTVENSLDYSLHNTLRQALFLPTRREHKYQGKAAIDTFFFRMGDVVAGIGVVFLLVEVLGLGARAFAGLNVGLALVWIALAARAGRVHDQLAAEARPEDDEQEADGRGRA